MASRPISRWWLLPLVAVLMAVYAFTAHAQDLGATPNGIAILTFAQMGTASSSTNGQLYYCSNCNQVNPCTAGGTGAFSFGYGGAWQCAAPGGTSIAGNSLAAHNFANSINSSGTIAGAQPAFTDISGTAGISQGGTGATTAYAAYQALATVNDQGTQASAVNCDLSVAPNCRWNGTSNNITLTVTNPPTNQWVFFEHIASSTKTLTVGANVFGYITSGAGTWQPSQGYTVTSGDNSFVGWSDGTNVYLYVTGADFNIRTVVANIMKPQQIGIGGDNNVSSMARLPLSFTTGAITTATNYGCYKTTKAITIENFEVSDELATGCAAGSVVRVYSCGASAPANAACSGGTQLTTGTTSTTAGTVVDGTVNSANVAAGQYVCAQVQALGASCSAVQLSATAMARPQ